MAPRKTTAKAAALNTAALIVIAGYGDTGGYAALADAQPLATHNPALIEMDTNMKDANGNVAVRATAAGIEMASKLGSQTGAATGAVAAEKPKFVIVAMKLPEIHRKGGGFGEKKSIYPFDDLIAPTADGNMASFFIPATAERPDPAKKLASTVSSATRRWSKKDTTNPTKQVERAKKNDAGEFVLDANGDKIKEMVTIDNLVPERQFVIREVGPDAEIKDGTAWGFAGQTGAAVFRTL